MSGPIVAMGGAEFAMRAENEALHDYVLGLASRPEPKICLLPTASGDPQEQITSFHAAMDRRGCVATSISLFRLGEIRIDLASHLLAQDIVYVTGGNMVNLMALWREHGLDEILCEAHRRGTVLCGYSAGSMCWFEWGVSRGVGQPVATRGLGLIEGSHCVHYAQDPSRRSAYRELLGTGAVPAGLALDDHAGALFRDGAMVEAVRSRESAGAYRVEAGPDGVVETALPVRLIESTPSAPREPALDEMRAIRRMRSGAGSRTMRRG
jgi:peptidase E